MNEKKSDFAYMNRELAWLDFNRRVLEQATRPATPLLERLRFLCITASNLDEFFMVRVGGLQMLRREGKRRPDPAGMSPARQLKVVAAGVNELLENQYLVWRELEQALAAKGLKRAHIDDLGKHEYTELREWCREELATLLTPMSLDDENFTPLLHGLKLYLLLRLEVKGQDRFAAIPLAPVGRLKLIPVDEILNYVQLEDIVTANIDLWFSGAKIKETVPFRLTRNADMAVREDEGEPFMQGMEKILQERKASPVVRLEIPRVTSATTLEFLGRFFDLEQNDIYLTDAPVSLADFFSLCDLETFEKLRYPAWTPYPSGDFNYEEPIFEQIAQKDLVLFHPYESFAPVIHFLEEAARDPGVLAIKQILYRTSAISPIVAALERAAQNGKYVTAVVELKARFDEERNISWARRLERAGVQVIYGVQGLKVHAKCCLVIRRENEQLRRYTHWSTGNYNEKTAMVYSDVGFFSAREDLGADASALFNALCGLDMARNFHKISVAPLTLRKRLTGLIDNEIKLARAGQKAVIMAKMNSLTDELVIRKLYEASSAGVEIKLNVRGSCCLVPGIPGLSENISVVSIVGRFLEHSRILYFHNGGSPQAFISSADWMERNIDKRVEVLVPVESKVNVKKLKEILQVYWDDTVDKWEQTTDGTFVLAKPGESKSFSCQKNFMQTAQKKAKQTPSGFKPYRKSE